MENRKKLIIIIVRFLNSPTKNGDNEDRETVPLRRSNRERWKPEEMTSATNCFT